MISHTEAIEAAREESRALGEVSITEVTPSRRDFRLYCTTGKESLAVIALLDPALSNADLSAQATAYDDAEAGALALHTAGLEASAVKLLADSVTAPMLRAGYVVAANQIYRARRLGFDAVLLPASEFEDAVLRDLTAVAASVHMAAVVVARSPEEMMRAADVPHAVIAVLPEPCLPETVREWSVGLDPQRTLVLLPELESTDAARPWLGVVDAVVLGRALADGDPADIVSSLA